MEISENLNFSIRYRGNGWPGIVRVNESELSWNRAAQIRSVEDCGLFLAAMFVVTRSGQMSERT